MTTPEGTRTFHDRLAVAYLARWLDTVDDPHLNWAWMIVKGVIDTYAQANTGPDTCFVEARREAWRDWFAAWDDGEAHFGIHGVAQELREACPDEHLVQLLYTVSESGQIGETGKLPKRPRRPGKGGAEAPRPAGLFLVVDNAGGARDRAGPRGSSGER